MEARVAISVVGAVQGIGFRPHVYRQALAHRLVGWVQNHTGGVEIEVQGAPENIHRFVCCLQRSPPPQSLIQTMEVCPRPKAQDGSFEIRPSGARSTIALSIPTDLAMCASCRADIQNPKDRRFGYAFTTCATCGPRYTLVEALPYDRSSTAMKDFCLCADCRREYTDPNDRRFHAQAMACPNCGPVLERVDTSGASVVEGVVDEAVRALKNGKIVALKGLGGFQLLVDATESSAVHRLRVRKRREEKPFAVMFPSLQAVEENCMLSPEEIALLTDPKAPIVLLDRRPHAPVAWAVAPENPQIGAMLPYTPLHALLLEQAGRPLVCTSGNLSGEPMCVEGGEARALLAPIADLFLDHNRPILRPVDDSVARLLSGRVQVLRRARGYAPEPIPFVWNSPNILALGGHLKNAIAFAHRGQIILSPHVGDLDSCRGQNLFHKTTFDLLRFFDVEPERIACDLHPDYASTHFAEQLAARYGVPLDRVQHHHAHIAAVVAEHQLEGEVLGFAWDGTGYGLDHTIWGGEVLRVKGAFFERIAHLRPFSLPGGEAAMRDGRRAAFGLCHEAQLGTLAGLDRLISGHEAHLFSRMLERNVQVWRTTSMGRLFDGVAALLGVRTKSTFEGQAAMALEAVAELDREDKSYRFALQEGPPVVIDWAPVMEALLLDRQKNLPVGRIAARFHRALANLVVELTLSLGSSLPVVVGGGCFQNRALMVLLHGRLREAGLDFYAPLTVPPNDGGLALGQAYVAARRGSMSCA